MDFQSFSNLVDDSSLLLALAIFGLISLGKLFLDFVKSTVLPRIYASHLQRKKIVLPLAEKLLDTSIKTPDFFRDGGPRAVDFEKGFIFTRPEVDTIKTIFQNNRFVFLEGAPSSGKSVLALHLAYDSVKKGHKVLYFKRPSMLSNEFIEFLCSPEGYEGLDTNGSMILVDDIHLDVASATKLLSLVYANFRNLKLLFISRPLSLAHEQSGSDWHFQIDDYMKKLPVKSDSIIPALSEDFSKRKFGKGIPLSVLNAFIDECGTDLLLLGRYLKVWDGSSMIHLPSIRDKVFQAVGKDLVALRIKDRKAIELILIVGIFYRFEIRIEREFLETNGFELDNLLKAGEILEENNYIYLHHSSLAKLYSNVIEFHDMAEYRKVVTRFSPMPVGLFKSYILSNPRNICEFLTRLNATRDILPKITADESTHEPLRLGLIREKDLNLLGWAVIILYSSNRKHGWKLLEPLDFSELNVQSAILDSAAELGLFLFNLNRVSKVKTAEWLAGTQKDQVANAICSMSLARAGHVLSIVKSASNTYFESLVPYLSPETICSNVLKENDIQDLKIGIARISRLFGDKVCVKASAKPDFVGDWTTRLTFYYETTRVIRFLSGRHRFPFAAARQGTNRYLKHLYQKRRGGATIFIDDGAVKAIGRNYSLFPVGVTDVKGTFEKQDVVEVFDLRNQLVAVGVSNFSSSELEKIYGKRSDVIAAETGILPNRVMDNDLIINEQRLNKITDQLSSRRHPS